jgi:hypothetical protein
MMNWIIVGQVITVIETEPQIAEIPAVKEKLNVLKEIVEDYAEQLSYSTDSDARVGHKTADSSFFGFKTHIAMSDERIITAAIVTTGEKSDGKYLKDLVEKSNQLMILLTIHVIRTFALKLKYYF